MNLKIQKEKYLVVTEFEFNAVNKDEIVDIWRNSKIKHKFSDYSFYEGVTKNTFVILNEIIKFDEMQTILESDEYRKFIEDIAKYIESDIHQEIFGLVDKVKARNRFIPKTEYMQLRTIEVPLSGIDEYLNWREQRIYKYVNKNELVKSFLSFHSVLSSTPGVLFVSEVVGTDINKYRESFLTDEYKIIIKEAGHDHIKGGLNTFEYKLLDKKEV